MCTIETVARVPIRQNSLIRRTNSLFAAKNFAVRPRAGKFASKALKSRKDLQENFRFRAKPGFARNTLESFAEPSGAAASHVADFRQFPDKFPDLREMRAALRGLRHQPARTPWLGATSAGMTSRVSGVECSPSSEGSGRWRFCPYGQAASLGVERRHGDAEPGEHAWNAS